jgi:hypothetical protein
MKKIVFDQPVNEIHINDVHHDSMVFVTKRGKAFAVIFIYKDDNCHVKTFGEHIAGKSFSDIKKWCGVECEFYAL